MTVRRFGFIKLINNRKKWKGIRGCKEGKSAMISPLFARLDTMVLRLPNWLLFLASGVSDSGIIIIIQALHDTPSQ